MTRLDGGNSGEDQIDQRYVDDQEKALRFYTEVLGFAKKTDFSNGPYRWLTVASPEEPTAPSCSSRSTTTRRPRPTSRPCFNRASPRPCSSRDDVKADYERIKARGAEFTMPPTEVTGSTIAKLNDTCGNLIQITQLVRW